MLNNQHFFKLLYVCAYENGNSCAQELHLSTNDSIVQCTYMPNKQKKNVLYEKHVDLCTECGWHWNTDHKLTIRMNLHFICEMCKWEEKRKTNSRVPQKHRAMNWKGVHATAKHTPPFRLCPLHPINVRRCKKSPIGNQFHTNDTCSLASIEVHLFSLWNVRFS